MTPKLKLLSRIMCWGFVSIMLAFIMFVAISFCVAVVTTQKTTGQWYEWQNAHIAELEAAYANGTAEKVNEADFCGFNYNQAVQGSKLNELRYLATHNSYKMGVSKETDFFYNRALPLFMGRQYDYVFDTITEQFNNGIRSIEIDVNKVKTDSGFTLRCVHSTILEQQSSMIDLEKGFKEMKMWSDYNPLHMPIIVLIEPKPGLAGSIYQDMDKAGYDGLEAMLSRVFGDKLITPDSVMGSKYSTLKDVRKSNAYPSLMNSRGKFMFLLHEKKNLFDTYIARDPSMKTQKMFMAAQLEETINNSYIMERTMFLVYNEKSHYNKIVSAIKNGNFMVRTRLDQYAFIDADRKTVGLDSGAQIMSTDYPPTKSGRYGYTCIISKDGSEKTMLLR